MRLVYCSPVKWRSFAQRPHEFVDWYHETFGGKVLWIEPYATRLPKLNDISNNSFMDITKKGNNAPEWLQIFYTSALPIEPLPLSHLINQIFWLKIIKCINSFTINSKSYLVIGKPSILALKIIKKINFNYVYYDAMDDFPAFYTGISLRTMEKVEREIIRKIDCCITSSNYLKKKIIRKGLKVKFVPNAFKKELLANLNNISKKNKPRKLGYVGTIGAWFDWELVITLAESSPEYMVEITGPVFCKYNKRLPKNIIIMPPVRHYEALNRMLTFTIGIIPFKENRLTRSVDPIKYYEYRALGLPILSTKFGEMKFRGNENGVFLISNKDNLSTLVEKASQYNFDESELLNFRSKNNWQSRFDKAEIFQ